MSARYWVGGTDTWDNTAALTTDNVFRSLDLGVYMKINFSFDTQYGTFNDAIHLPDDHTYTDAELETMKQTRLDNWIAIITAPPVENLEEVIE